MKLKKIVTILLTVMMICTSLSVVTFASYDVSPAYDIANEVSSELSINGTSATCSSYAFSSTAVKIKVEQTLQKQSLWFWNDVSGATWTKTVSTRTIDFTNSKSSLSSGTYRVKSVFTLTNSSGESETITIYSDEKTI